MMHILSHMFGSSVFGVFVMKKSFLTLSIIVTLLFTPLTYAAPLGTRTVLDNGATLLVAERPGVPMVIFNILLKSGAASDPTGKEGVANLTAELLTRGTKQYSAQALAEELDFLGASLGVDADLETTTITLTTLTKNLDAALSLLTAVLLTPTFPETELGKKQTEVLGGLKSREEDPGWVAQRAFLEKLYPGHPYGRLVEGQPASLTKVTRADVVHFHQTYYRPNNAIIAAAGDITQAQIVQILQTHFANWQRADIPAVAWPEEQQPKTERITLDKKVTQANVALGHVGVARANPDYYAVQVMNYILGAGGFGSRLMDKIREELGLVYNVGSSFSARKHAGPFTVSLQTKNASAVQALDETMQVIRRFTEEGPTDKEVEAAKSYLINSFPLRLVSNRDVASLLPVLEFYELGLDYPDRYPTIIGNITREQAHAAAKSYLHPDRMLQVVVADLTQAGLAKP
jgi:zinc protease